MHPQGPNVYLLLDIACTLNGILWDKKKIKNTNKIECSPETDERWWHLTRLGHCLYFSAIKMKVSSLSEFNYSCTSTVQILDSSLGLLDVAEK